jgi:hypothetical protein
VVPLVVHPVVSKYDQQGVLVQQIYDPPQHIVHLLQLFPHRRSSRPDPMSDMVHPEEVTDDNVPIRRVR